MPSKARVTVRTIAKSSGWSLGTVSRVLNHAGDVSEKAVADITKAIEELGYHPNPSARNLRRQAGSGVLVALSQTMARRYGPLCTRIVRQFESEGEDVTLRICPDLDDVYEWIKRTRPSCQLLAGFRREDILHDHGRMKIPAIVIGADLSRFEAEDLHSFYADDTEIALQATEALFLSGCSSIGWIGVDRALCSEAADAVLGMQYAFYARDRIFSFSSFSQNGTADYSGGYDAFMRLHEMHPELDGLLVFDPAQAMGVLRAAFDLGLVAGRDLRIICLQNDPLLDYAIPRLARVEMEIEAQCENVTARLNSLRNEKRGLSESTHACFLWTLHFDESCENPLPASEIE